MIYSSDSCLLMLLESTNNCKWCLDCYESRVKLGPCRLTLCVYKYCALSKSAAGGSPEHTGDLL